MEIISSYAVLPVPTQGQTPSARKRCTAVTVGNNIYYLGGAPGATKEVTSVIPVFDTESSTWSSIQTTLSVDCNEYIQPVVMDTNIWVLSDDKWHCFDTAQKQWRQIQIKTHRKLHHIKAFATIGDTIYYYDGSRSSMERKVYRFNTSTNEISTSAEEGFGEHPQERIITIMTALSNDIILLCSPYDYYEAKHEFGEVLYYDLKEDKWARAQECANGEKFDLEKYIYAGKIGAQMVFVPKTLNERNKLRILDLDKMTWQSHKLVFDKEVVINSAIVLRDKVYCWLENGQMAVVALIAPNNEEQQQIDHRLVEVAKTALANIKRPIVEPQEFKTDPITIDAGLEPVDLNDVKIHYQLISTFAKMFPKIDGQTKIIENAVPEPSNTTYLHQNLMHYLMLAWSNHFSVVISPDMIFYTILCEIADEILSDPDVFRHLFTDSTEKKSIITITHDPTKIDLNQIIDGIAQNVAVDASIFTANFSSSTVESRLAIQAAFCDAMLAYFNYISTLCGIPRVKVLGTKQDWQTLEHKIHRMRTEVFNQDTTTSQKMSEYLHRAETYVHKIYTTRDPAFWKDMFSINRCVSGHTDVVEGWIVMFYREGYAIKERGVMKYEGNDYYNYKSHISTVKWHNDDTQRHFELKTGLLFSNVVRGDSEDDVKYPWLEPQFSHVIVETDGSGKMTPEQFKKYINETLQGGYRKLMKEFYDVLKHDPVEVVTDGPKNVDFRFQLVIRQIDAWMKKYEQDGISMKSLDLSTGPCGLALKFYSDIKDENKKALDSLVQKIEEYLALDKNINSINFGGRLGLIEGRIIEFLTKQDPSRLEELVMTGDYTDAYERLSVLLTHPDCQLRKLQIENKDFEEWNPDRSSLAKALLVTTAPLETLIFDKVELLALAGSISYLCAKELGLKHFESRNGNSSDCEIEMLRAIAESKTLQTISLNELGLKRVTTDDGRTEYVKAVDRDLTKFLIQHLPQNTSLQTIKRFHYQVDPLSKTRILSIPSLRNLSGVSLTDLSFLAVTTQLEKLSAELKQISAEQMKYLANLISRQDSKLESLEISRAEMEFGAGSVLAKAFCNNTALKKLDINHAVIKGDSNVHEMMEAISDWISQPSCNLEYLDVSEICDSRKLVFFGEYLRNIFEALAKNNKIKWLKLAVIMEQPELDLLTELVRKNTSLTHIKLLSEHTEFTAEQKAPLAAAIKANNNLVEFYSYFTSFDEGKSPVTEDDDF